ncbi:MAG: DedA family protein [Planctomycetota bacterium]
MDLVDLFFHLDRHLNEWAAQLGPWLYGVLFLIVFCETGLVVTPFLPGDSLLFAVGALAAAEGSTLSLPLLFALLVLASVAGDAANYAIGSRVGPRIFRREDSWFFHKRHLERAQRFYERHGGKAIVLARFLPILRTFAPFVAGIGRMSYPRFALFNVAGGLTWVAVFLLGGHAFGNLPLVKYNFHYVVLAIVALSCAPLAIEFLLSRRGTRA